RISSGSPYRPSHFRGRGKQRAEGRRGLGVRRQEIAGGEASTREAADRKGPPLLFLLTLRLHLRFLVPLSLLHRRIATGLPRGLGRGGRWSVTGHGALLGRILGRPCGSGRRRVCLRA